MTRLNIDDDTIRQLSTFQSLGEKFDVKLPTEMLPVGARTVARGLRTRAAAELGSDWVWPHWLERQTDPTSSAFVPRGHLPFLTNVTQRNWTAIGNIDSRWEAIVDPRGLVTTWVDGWSLDWWIGADDRWHLPSREVAVRQALVDAAPVVETAMRVPGGDAVHRAYAIRRPSAEGSGELVVVEVENRSKVPVALALALRPYNPEGLSVVERIAMHPGAAEGTGAVVTVDGETALILPKAPSAAAASTFHDGDSVSTVLSGQATTDWPGPVHCVAGLAQAAFVYPLAHGATLRAVIPVVPERHGDTRRRSGRRKKAGHTAPVTYPAVLPSAEDVARGWQAQSRRGMRLELPDDRLAEAVDANRRFLLLAHDGDEITPGPATYHRFWFRDAAYLLNALDYYGYHDEVAEVLASYPDRQRTDGFFFSQPQEWDANGAALWSLAQHLRLTGDRTFVEDMVGPIAKGVHWIERKRGGKGRSRRRAARADQRLAGLLPAGVSAEHLGPFDYFYWDNFWGVAGLRAGAELLSAIDQPEAAADAERFAGRMWHDLERSLALSADRLGTPAIPAGPRRRIDPGTISALAATWPLELMTADDERMAATADIIRERFTLANGHAVYQGISHTGLGTYLTLQLAGVELAAGDPRCVGRLQWLLDAASPTWTWPEAIHPGLAGGCMGDGHHGWAGAELLRFVRQMLVRDTVDGLVLASVVPESWLGQGWEVHDAPTRHGLFSYAVRWHGERPALLWDLRPHEAGQGLPAADPVTITVPGLDPAWSSSERRGEALLAPVARPEGPASSGSAPSGAGPLGPTETPVSFG